MLINCVSETFSTVPVNTKSAGIPAGERGGYGPPVTLRKFQLGRGAQAPCELAIDVN